MAKKKRGAVGKLNWTNAAAYKNPPTPKNILKYSALSEHIRAHERERAPERLPIQAHLASLPRHISAAYYLAVKDPKTGKEMLISTVPVPGSIPVPPPKSLVGVVRGLKLGRARVRPHTRPAHWQIRGDFGPPGAATEQVISKL